MEDTTAGSPPPGGEETSASARLFGALFSPAKTFESIARKPGWVLPGVILLVWVLGSGFFISTRFDADAIVERQLEVIEERGGTITDATADQMRQGTEFLLKLTPIIGVVFAVAVLFLVPLIYHGIAAAWGKSTSYKAVLAGYAHVQMIHVVKGILFVIVTLPRTKIDPEGIPRLLKSNVGAFLDPETHPGLLALTTNLDVFEIWACVVGSIALSRVTRLTPQGAAAVVFGAWLAWVLLSAGLASLGAMFR